MTILLMRMMNLRRVSRKSRWYALLLLDLFALGLDSQPLSPVTGTADVWQVPVSQNLLRHFEVGADHLADCLNV